MAKSRKVSSISKEFDGKEVEGKRIERSGLFGSKVTKEVFNFPKGGKHIEKTRTNKKGDVVSRMSKDTKVNPLVFFNKNKEQAYKKAGGAITTFKKSLKKAQDGIQVNPMPTLPTKQVPSKLMENVEKRKKIGAAEYQRMLDSNKRDKAFYDKSKSELAPGMVMGEFSPTYTESRQRPDLKPSTWKNLSQTGLYTTPDQRGNNPVPSNIESTYYKKGGAKKKKK